MVHEGYDENRNREDGTESCGQDDSNQDDDISLREKKDKGLFVDWLERKSTTIYICAS